MIESGYVRFNTLLAQASTEGLGMCPLLINTDICISQTETVDIALRQWHAIQMIT